MYGYAKTKNTQILTSFVISDNGITHVWEEAALKKLMFCRNVLFPSLCQVKLQQPHPTWLRSWQEGIPISNHP